MILRTSWKAFVLPIRPPAFSSRAPKLPGSQLTAMVTFVVVTGILYFGRDVLIPLALSVLLAFLLAPGVRHLERRKVPRTAATAIMVGMSCIVMAALIWVSVAQFLNLAASLPEYKKNIQNKVSVLRSDIEGSLGRARRTIDEISSEMAKDGTPVRKAPSARLQNPADRPVPVTIEDGPSTPFEFVRDIVTLLIVPLTAAGAVILFTFIILLRREDLRDRLIRLVGHGQLNVTTQVFEEAANRVSRYLRVQLIVNVTYGLPVGIALYALGVPNAALWGLLATALRFIPYIGAWIAAAMPIGLAFALSDGWSLVLWTVSVFVVLELVSNNIIEPWAYGSSTGMSAIAIIAAAIFWTWLWGAIGLLLAVPLTVCLVVMGQYVPQFAFLSIMLGDQPVLPLEERLYQRLLARDHEEAVDLAEAYVQKHGLEALYESVLIPVLSLAERDRHSDALSDDRTRFVFDSMRTLVDEIADRVVSDNGKSSEMASSASTPEPPSGPISVCIVPARDEADEIVGAMLQRRLTARNVSAELLTTDVLKSEVLERVAELAPQSVYISALPPAAVLHASFFCKRLRPRFPDLKIVVGLWHADGGLEKGRARLVAAGASEVVATLKDSIEKLPPAALVTAMQSPDAQPDSAAGENRTSSAPSTT
ncbi:MAG TPA: AI-2E family transporter [Burkholderiaceae bacterium]|nr:AI-2E family transporter [Burkholderiaceae bacterium]